MTKDFFNFGDDFNSDNLHKFFEFKIANNSIYIIINSEYLIHWSYFFNELVQGLDYETAKYRLINRVAKHQYPDILEENIISIWKNLPEFFINGQLKTNLQDLEDTQNLKSILREISIKKIID